MSEFKVVLEAGRIEKNYWKDIWSYRELFYILSWRDIKVRYKQTVIGAAWSVLRPILTMIIFTIVFSKVAKLTPEGGAPYSIMVFSALLPWYFFANSLSEASQSLITNSNLITKVYFPRIIIPLSSIIVNLIDFFISLAILIVLMVFYKYIPPIKILFVPLFLVLVFFLAFGTGLFITALNVKYRDFRFVIPFIIQIGLYISPIGFSTSIIPDKWKMLYYLNPMVGIIDGFRWCIIGNNRLDVFGLLMSVVTTFIIVLIGVRYFRKTERSFADSI